VNNDYINLQLDSIIRDIEDIKYDLKNNSYSIAICALHLNNVIYKLKSLSFHMNNTEKFDETAE